MSVTQLQKSKAQYSIQYRIDGLNDPSVVATDGSIGTEYAKTSFPPGLFIKQDDGVTTNWLPVITGASLVEGTLGTDVAPYLVSLPTDQIIATAPGQSIVFLDSGATAPGPAPGSPAMGTARDYAVLGATTVTNVGLSVLNGDLGVSPGAAIVGFPPGVVTGSTHAADAAAAAAQASALVAYTDLSTRPSITIPSILDGQILGPGVYSFLSGAATLAQGGPATLTLNGGPNDIFVIQTATTITMGAGGAATVLLTGGARPENVYWAVGSSATINVNAGAFVGNVIAQTSITIDNGVVSGSMIALTGAVTISSASAMTANPVAPAGSPAPVTLTGDPVLIDDWGYIGKVWTVVGKSTLDSQVTLLSNAHLQINGSWNSLEGPNELALFEFSTISLIQITATVAGVARYRTLGKSA